ncbi:MAG: hypothetical protein ACRYGB_04490 [Janthinobacterium lividum]
MEYQSDLKKPEIVEPPKKYRESKFWIRAKRRYNDKHMQLSNSNTEDSYHKVLKKVKALFTPRNVFVYERDYKRDISDSLTRMYVFQCESLYLELWCCFSEFYFVDYHFDNCPFEQEILAFMIKNYLSSQMRNFPLDKGFFQRKIDQENEKFFYYLEVEAAE